MMEVGILWMWDGLVVRSLNVPRLLNVAETHAPDLGGLGVADLSGDLSSKLICQLPSTARTVCQLNGCQNECLQILKI